MNEEDRKALTELATGFRIFIKEWDVVKGKGFRFCGVNESRIDELEKSHAWLRSVVIGLILLILTASVGYFVEDRRDGFSSTETRGRISDVQPDGNGKGNPGSSEHLVKG